MPEDVNRGLLGVIGLWKIWRAFSHGHHHKHEGEAVGFMAGLIPRPLTVFVGFAISRGVPVAGLLFAVTMMAGVALTLSSVAVLSTLFREHLVQIFEIRPRVYAAISRAMEGAAGIFLAGVAVWQIAAV
ncbi:hypothetical protein P9272_29845 [Mesorhizobium sp. WSM4976]|uniref:hypothetical protein n=1 Tax=Mesorhizobium sp. WSM4976 TaxID=3038549 RepID=UPI002415D47A|nr:hypothetical protein [Mesorhizobium sp. WSM4976]MDG4897746.1 hypothetical protein [Mesorhizobium sp. WSM4976]